MNRGDAIAGAGSVLGLVGAVGLFLPSYGDVVAAGHTDGTMWKKVRVGEVTASAWLLAAGAASAVIARDWLPFWIAVALAAGLVASYELSMRWDG